MKLTNVRKKKVADELKNKSKTQSELCCEYSTSKGTVSRIQQNIEFYLDQLRNPEPNSQIKAETTAKTEMFSKLDSYVIGVFCRIRESYIAINGHTIKYIDLKITKELGLHEFKAAKNSGILDRSVHLTSPEIDLKSNPCLLINLSSQPLEALNSCRPSCLVILRQMY